VNEPSPSARTGAIASRTGLAARLRRGLADPGRAATTLALDLLVLKPLALFVWWFSQRANTLRFGQRSALLRRTRRALAAGRPVVFASNHVSWFDDPVIPMALYRTGQRAGLELLALASLVGVCWLLAARGLAPPAGVGIALAGAAGIAALGTRKLWWTLGALENLSDASVLRGKLALTRQRAPGPLLRALLRIADGLIPWFMHSGTVRTIFVDRRPGEQARRVRARAVTRAVEVAERPEPVWVFFEGGRTKVPGVIAPARRGIGSLLLRLRERGRDPLVIVVYHEGMERLIPPGGSRFLSSGHAVVVGWSELDVAAALAAAGGDDQTVADAVREEAIRLQARLRLEARQRHPEVRPA